MALDPTKHPDWQIAQDAEKSMKTVETLAAELGLEKDELLPYGHYMGKIDDGGQNEAGDGAADVGGVINGH